MFEKFGQVAEQLATNVSRRTLLPMFARSQLTLPHPLPVHVQALLDWGGILQIAMKRGSL